MLVLIIAEASKNFPIYLVQFKMSSKPLYSKKICLLVIK